MTDEQKKKVAALRRNGLGYTAVASRTGLSKDTVKSFCRRNGLAGEMAAPEDGNVKHCRECGSPMPQEDGVKPRVFCSNGCRIKWWKEHPEKVRKKAVYHFTCAYCGRPFTAYGNSHRKYCSHECYIADRFQGGGADG